MSVGDLYKLNASYDGCKLDPYLRVEVHTDDLFIELPIPPKHLDDKSRWEQNSFYKDSYHWLLHLKSGNEGWVFLEAITFVLSGEQELCNTNSTNDKIQNVTKHSNKSAKKGKKKMADTKKIDEAINAATRRKASREGTSVVDASSSGTKQGRKRLTAEEKASREASQEASRAAKKAEREAKRASRMASKKPAHLAKVEKAAMRLPNLTSEATVSFGELTEAFNLNELEALSAHLAHFVRAQRTQSALRTELKVGQVVRIVSGAARFIGQTAVLDKVQRIRVYARVAGEAKPVYLFASDVEVVAEGESLNSSESRVA